MNDFDMAFQLSKTYIEVHQPWGANLNNFVIERKARAVVAMMKSDNPSANIDVEKLIQSLIWQFGDSSNLPWKAHSKND
ncbi:MAG TPA: hypothetical protein V6D27_01090 [Vampirovibrionales bacterium]